jgi:hypothetical protein
MALEDEIERWKPFRKALHTEEDRKAFEAMMDFCRSNGMASSAACNPVIFEPMVLSILLAQQKKLNELEYKLNEVFWQRICTQETESKTIKRNPT